MDDRRLALGVVGAGRLVERGYLPALSIAGGFRLAAVAEPDPARRRRLVELAGTTNGRHRVAPYADVVDMIAATNLDAVVVATPAEHHLDAAGAAAEAGIPTLVEKPPAPDAAGAVELAAMQPTPPWIAFNRRFDPGVAAVRRAAPGSGPLDIEVRVEYRRAAWEAHVVRDDAWLDLGAHLVDLVRWVGSCEIVEVSGADLSPERAEVDLRTTRGRAALLARTDRIHREHVAIGDDQGRTIARHRLGGFAAGIRGRLDRRQRSSELVRSLAAQLDAFAEEIATGQRTALATADDGVAAMRVLDAAASASQRPSGLAPSGRT